MFNFSFGFNKKFRRSSQKMNRKLIRKQSSRLLDDFSLTVPNENCETLGDEEKYDGDVSVVSLGSMASSMVQSSVGEYESSGRWEIHQSITDCIGETPIIKLQRLAPEGVNIYVKCENMNPGGSLKDRLALGVIEYAEKTGKLVPGQVVVEASSGNTGIGLAMVCASRGYPFICVMSEAFSIERRKLMRYLGARVVLTPKEHKATGMVMKAQAIAETHGFFYARQFENEANAWIHQQTTGPEIIKAFKKEGKKLDAFFMAYGTGGTALGVGRALREKSPRTKIHLCEPSTAAMLSSGIKTNYPTEGVTTFDSAHPVWQPHSFQGWATDFIPKLAAMAQDEGIVDKVVQVAGQKGIETARKLAKMEGLFVGISGGGILSAALEYAYTCEKGTNIVAVLTDTGERYMSTALFNNIPVEMTPQEQKLSDSTPSRPPPPSPGLSGIMPENTDDLFDS